MFAAYRVAHRVLTGFASLRATHSLRLPFARLRVHVYDARERKRRGGLPEGQVRSKDAIYRGLRSTERSEPRSRRGGGHGTWPTCALKIVITHFVASYRVFSSSMRSLVFRRALTSVPSSRLSARSRLCSCRRTIFSSMVPAVMRR